MAGGLFFLGSSVRARSLNLPSFDASSCQCHPWRSKLLSKCLVRKKKLVSLCSKPTSFGLVSTSECSDGSVVFHFGDVSEMPEDEPLVEASVHFQGGEEKDSNVDALNKGIESVVCLEVIEGDREEEANSEGSLILALTEAVRSGAVDSHGGVFPKNVDDQLVLSGTMDQQGDSHLEAATTPEGIDMGNGPFEEIQLRSEASNYFASDLSIVEDNHTSSEEDIMENSLEECQNPVFLANDAVEVEDSSAMTNDLDTYSTIEGGSGVTSDVKLLQLEKLDTIAEDAASTSIGFDTEFSDAIEHSEEHAKINISDLPNEVEERADLNLANRFLSGNISHQSEIVQVSELLEVEPSPSEARDDIFIDARKEDMTITPVADDSTSFNQEDATEKEKASAGFGVGLIGNEKMQTETAVIKRKDTLEMGLYLSSGVASLPHPSKESTVGEDVHFIQGNWLGIADGVGQWSMEGASASSYAQELLENCQEILSPGKSNSMTDPAEVIVRGARETHSSGLSTVMVSSFDGQVLQVAGIGDSGFIIIRNGNVLEKSAPMLHELNLPIQMHKGIDPSPLIKLYSVRLDEDDVIVLATNGLFDNLYEREIALIVSDCSQSGQRTTEIARLLAKGAREVGKSKSGRSPFADAAHAACYVGYTGGKQDDVTVIVSLVERNPDSHSSLLNMVDQPVEKPSASSY